MTTFPLAIPEQGLVITGWPAQEVARSLAAAWLQTVRGLTAGAAETAVDGARVVDDAHWSDEIVTDPDGSHPRPACFVGPSYPGASPVSVIEIPLEYLAAG